MKIGISTDFYERWAEGRYKKMKEHGYTHVDFGMNNPQAPIYSCGDKEFEIKMLRAKSLMEEAGIGISQAHGPFRWPPQDDIEEKRKELMDTMKRSIYGTFLLGCKNWVMHPFMPCGIEDKDTEYAEKTWEVNMMCIRELLETAKRYGVTICLENMPLLSYSLGSPSEVLKFVKAMNDENLRICLDVGHAAVYKDATPADFVRELGDAIRVLHVHDNNGQHDLHLIPYFGVVDWKDFGKALKEINFEGVFSYETALPAQLPTELFEEMSQLLIRIAKEINA